MLFSPLSKNNNHITDLYGMPNHSSFTRIHQYVVFLSDENCQQLWEMLCTDERLFYFRIQSVSSSILCMPCFTVEVSLRMESIAQNSPSLRRLSLDLTLLPSPLFLLFLYFQFSVFLLQSPCNNYADMNFNQRLSKIVKSNKPNKKLLKWLQKVNQPANGLLQN